MPTKPSPFPIVAIGASAGGLEAFEDFLRNVPENCGMAFVIIQHLDPTQKGMLPELLQRITKMEVIQVKDRTRVKPDSVYVIPPNTSMSILKGVLHLFQPVEVRGLRLPIDFFFRSLADDCHEHAVGVILSGMGSDGSLGLRAIKEKNGTVLTQDPVNAKFSSMPRNAIDSGLVDIVAPANELPIKMIEFLKHLPKVKQNLETEIKDQSSLEKIIILLRTRTGNDFSLYKKNTIYRRIERRMSVHRIEKITSYVRFLQENPKEVDILFKELLIGVTNFFRDPLVWEKLRDSVFPDMFSTMKPGTVLRAWVPGCSTGEEAFSLAMVFKEALEKMDLNGGFSLQIFATDLDGVAIETARKGVFHSNIEADVSANRLNRFFISTEEGYRINAEIREMVVFAQHNIIWHPPFTKLDILTCRNLLIYLDTELQSKLHGLFYYSINPEGILVLGSAETLGSHGNLFNQVDSKLKIFKRSSTAPITLLTDFPSAFSRNKITGPDKEKSVKSSQNIEALADQLMLQQFSPAGVLVNENGDIIYFSGHTGKYLEPAVGKANLNIFAMLREGLRTDFPIAFRKAILNKKPVVLGNIKIQYVDKPEALNGMLMVIFNDVPEIQELSPKVIKGKISGSHVRQSELEEELVNTREEMQTMLEEMQTSQEELKSTNEELQSANEELQSTNEELTTSKEEMQSLNEELQTVNSELQSKLDEFSRVNNDMKNLLNSTDIATLFLDKELNIRRYTNQATKIFKLIKSDIGRPFTDQVTDLLYPDLAADAHEVLRTLIFIEKQIPSKDGQWFSIRIMPYRTYDDRIDGLVITFFDMSTLKQVEVKLHESEHINHLLAQSSQELIIKLSSDWKILEFNTEAEKVFGKKQKEVVNEDFVHLFVPEPDQGKVKKELETLLTKNPDSKFKMKVLAAKGNILGIEWLLNINYNSQREPSGVIIISKRKNSNE